MANVFFFAFAVYPYGFNFINVNAILCRLPFYSAIPAFSNIFCKEFGEKDKEINKFQHAILKLGIPPCLVIAFENEETEITNAKQAGIKIINPIIMD